MNSKKVYIDVTNYIRTESDRGICRVVYNYIVEFIDATLWSNIEVILLYNPNGSIDFNIVNNDKFKKFRSEKRKAITSKKLLIDEIKSNSIFFDIDSSWKNNLKRSYLLKELKKRNIIIFCYLYDIFFIQNSKLCKREELFQFSNYFTAHLEYADAIIVPSQDIREELKKIIRKLNLKKKKIYVNMPVMELQEEKKDFKKISSQFHEIINEKYVIYENVEKEEDYNQIMGAYNTCLRKLNIKLVFTKDKNNSFNFNSLRKDEDFNHLFFILEANYLKYIDTLYYHSYAIIFVNYTLEQKLSVLEALQAKKIVLLLDLSMNRSYAGRYGDYYKVDNFIEASKKIEQYLLDNKKYLNRCAINETYKVHSLSESIDLLIKLINRYFQSDIIEDTIKQIVVMPEKLNIFLETIPYIEEFMNFVEEIVIICGSYMKDKVVSNYKGKIKLVFIEVNAEIEDLNKDLIFYEYIMDKRINECFLMTEDSIRPLYKIEKEEFLEERFNIFYYEKMFCNGEVNNTLRKTKDYFINNGYCFLNYNCGMPQIIKKSWYIEMLLKNPDIKKKQLCRINTYFNYCVKHHAKEFNLHLAKEIHCDNQEKDYMFENFQIEDYMNGGIFSGYCTNYTTKTVHENINKILIMERNYLLDVYRLGKAGRCRNKYKEKYGIFPSFSIVRTEEEILINFPSEVYLDISWMNFLDVYSIFDQSIHEGYIIEWFLIDEYGEMINKPKLIGSNKEEVIRLQISGTKLNQGKLVIKCRDNLSKKEYIKQINFSAI